MQTINKVYKMTLGEEVFGNDAEIKYTNKEKSFEDYLDECDVDIQIKFHYLDDLLCKLDDQISETFANIHKVRIDEDIAEKLLEINNDVRFDFLEANKEGQRFTKKLKFLEQKYDVVEDMYEEMILKILM